MTAEDEEMTPDEEAAYWRDHAQTGVDTPGCDCGHASMGIAWHASTCAWRQPAYWGGESAPADRWGSQPRRGDAVRVVEETLGRYRRRCDDGCLASVVVDALLAAGLIVEGQT